MMNLQLSLLAVVSLINESMLFINGWSNEANTRPHSHHNHRSTLNANSANTDVLRRLAQAISNCGGNHHSSRQMKKVLLHSKTNATCNDGSPAGYYVRKVYGSKRWIIFLEGGWYCFDFPSCLLRWNGSKSLMTSTMWPDTRHMSGIMSSDPSENPYWWNANHVFIPYCSSDSWSGNLHRTSERGFSFLGSLIIEELVKDLFHNYGLNNATKIILAGSSAGGTGVILNLDRVATQLTNMGSKADVRGITDSGWFLDNTPFSPFSNGGCTNIQSCTATESIKQGYRLWNGRVPEECAKEHPHEPWLCYLGYKAYPTIKTPLFVFQWMFDEAQLTLNNVGMPVSKQQWDYIHQMGTELRKTLENVTALFVPSCISHGVLHRRDWKNVKVNDVSLPQAIRCWETSPGSNGHKHNQTKLTSLDTNQIETSNSLTEGLEDIKPFSRTMITLMAADSPQTELVETTHHHKTNNATRKHSSALTRRTGEGEKYDYTLEEDGSKLTKKERRRRRRMQRKREKQRQREERRKERERQIEIRRKEKAHRNRRRHERMYSKRSLGYDHHQHRWDAHTNQCQHHIVEKCTWPQCNRSCPKLTNPFTGEELDFVELLKSFGLDMQSVAQALGVDLNTLNNMDQNVLLHLLTQQAN